MFAQDDDENNRVALFSAFGVVTLAVSLVIGLAVYATNKNKRAAAKPSAVALAAVPALASASGSLPVLASGAANDRARVVVEAGVVKFYFASGKTELAMGGKDALLNAAKAAQSGKKAVVSGFADATGDAEKNAELSKLRAYAVRDALVAMGVAPEKIELRKPAAVTANAAGASVDARRVDVTLE